MEQTFTADNIEDVKHVADITHFVLTEDADGNVVKIVVNPDGVAQDVEFSDDPKGN